MFEPKQDPGDIPRICHSITEKEAWEIALSTHSWPYANFITYFQELVEAGFISPAHAKRKKA